MAINIRLSDMESYKISTTREGERWYDFGEGWKKIPNSCANLTKLYDQMMQVCRRRSSLSYEEEEKLRFVVNSFIVEEQKVKNTVTAGSSLVEFCNNMIKFFSEFHFEPNYRFVNTFAFMSKEGLQDEYVTNYFKLIDSPYSNSVAEKMKSPEWTDIIVKDFKDYVNPSRRINKRFKLYFGSQGTGKTTVACRETDDRCIVCHSSILPSDLMEDFSFNDGKAQFNPSAFMTAMTEGYSITLDEINLLPFDTLRFLQSILDEKTEFIYKGRTIKIKEGFSIIGTMNLVVGGSVFSLPDPLVDRAGEIKEFKLTAESLANSVM